MGARGLTLVGARVLTLGGARVLTIVGARGLTLVGAMVLTLAGANGRTSCTHSRIPRNSAAPLRLAAAARTCYFYNTSSRELTRCLMRCIPS